MTHTWEQYEGVSIAGTYGLDQWLGSDASGAFYSTSGPNHERAVLKLIEVDPASLNARFELLQRVGELRHPNLMALLDCGRYHSDGGSLLYAVFEAPEDSLTAAMQNGPMIDSEALDVFASAVDALDYLHTRGWAHTSLDSEHIVAVGDRIKLATDTLQYADEGSTAQSNDVWALGALTYELVSGRRLERGRYAAVSGISDPLGSMIQHSTEPDQGERWTAAQLHHTLNPSAAEPVQVVAVEPEPPAPAEPMPVNEPLVSTAPDVKPGSEAVPEVHAAPHVPEPQPEPPPRTPIMVHEPYTTYGEEVVETEEEPVATGPTIARFVPIGAVAAIALLALTFVLAHHGSTVPQAVAITPPPPVAETPAAPAPRPGVRAATPKNSPASPPVVRAATPRNSPTTWRVISYTYFRKEDAQKKAESINKRYADIHAEVFTLGTKPPSYLISLGAHMTMEEANALRRKALARGLPHDTFIRNFAD